MLKKNLDLLGQARGVNFECLKMEQIEYLKVQIHFVIERIKHSVFIVSQRIGTFANFAWQQPTFLSSPPGAAPISSGRCISAINVNTHQAPTLRKTRKI